MLNWAVGREYLDNTPFRRGTETLIKKLREDNRRRRRLSPDEELRLLAAAPPHLGAMIITALNSGLRRGEMLALRFADVDFTRGLITLRGETTKSKRTRLVPISTQRLRVVLEWRRIDAEGKQKSDETLVFSDEIGEPLPHFHDMWLRTVLRAHGIKPRWTARLKHKGLSSESKNAFRKINLRWHDLRHEYASRLVERAVPLAQVHDLLGHASITTTERYDNQKLENLQIAAAKLESGLTFEPPGPVLPNSDERARRKSARAKSQASFKYEGVEPRSRIVREVPAIEPNELNDLGSADWLAVRDDFRNWLTWACGASATASI